MELTVGEKIKALRKQYKMTQLDLAQKIGISKSTIAMYEISRNYPNVEMIKKLCLALNTTGDYLIGLVDNPNERYNPSGKKADTLAADEERLLGNYNKLNTSGKEKAQDYTEDLTENEKYTRPDTELGRKLNA